MKADKKPVIGLICVVLCCTLVFSLTLGLLMSANRVAPNTPPMADATVETPKDLPEAQPELEWGYKFKRYNGAIDGGWVGHIAYRSQTSTFAVDEVKLTISFGSCWPKMEYAWDVYYVPEFEIYFADPSGYIADNFYTARKVNEQLFSEEYRATYVDDEQNNLSYYEFNHSEEISVPKELFSESGGRIRIVIGGMNYAPYNENKYLIFDVVTIDYRLIENNQVQLSVPTSVADM